MRLRKAALILTTLTCPVVARVAPPASPAYPNGPASLTLDRMQWLDPDGNARFPPGGLLVAGGSANQADAVMAAHPTAGVFVAFTQDNAVVVQSFDGAGDPRWPLGGVVVADKAPDEVLRTPHVVASPDDGVFVCFVYSGSGPRIDIRCQHVDET